MVSELCRYLPLLLDNLNKDALERNLRLKNAVRLLKHQTLPRLERINKEKGV